MRFLARHWRGELPLAQALWLNGVALTAVLLGFGRLSIFGRWQSVVDSYPDLTVLTATSLLLLVVIPAWQIRGLWKAAGHHIVHVGTILAGRSTQAVATLMMLLALMRVAGAVGDVIQMAPIALNTGIYRAEVKVGKNDRELMIRGGFGFGLADRISGLLIEYPSIRRIRLESWGGSLTEATELARLIERRRLNTYIARHCTNTCVVPFIAGRHRTLRGLGRLAFTDAYGLPQSASDQLLRRGVRPQFLRNWQQFNPRTWYPTERELRFGGIVDTVLQRPGR